MAKPTNMRALKGRTQRAEHSMGTLAIQRVVGAAGQLAQALRTSVKASGGPSNGGFENRGPVLSPATARCAIAFSGSRATDRWKPGA
jgi:hypothetical protein